MTDFKEPRLYCRRWHCNNEWPSDAELREVIRQKLMFEVGHVAGMWTDWPHDCALIGQSDRQRLRRAAEHDVPVYVLTYDRVPVAWWTDDGWDWAREPQRLDVASAVLEVLELLPEIRVDVNVTVEVEDDE